MVKDPCPQVAHSLVGETDKLKHVVNCVLEGKTWYEDKQIVEQELGKTMTRGALKKIAWSWGWLHGEHET